MREFMGPPSGWYDPPAVHESHCACQHCHATHLEDGLVSEYANDADHDCCRRELDSWIEANKWCAVHGDAYIEKIDKRYFCAECGYEMIAGLKAANF